HLTDSTWPFEMWGMDIMGTISPPSAKGHRFILAVTDYFSKWAEAIPLREVKTSDVIQFIKHHVIYRFGVPRRIVHDNGPQFISYSFQWFCAKFRIQTYPLQCITDQLMVLPKPSTKPSKNCSRSLFLI